MLLEEDEAEIERERVVPQHVSVLTTEYIAKGLDDTGYSIFEAADDARMGDADGSGFILTDAIVQSVGGLHTPARTFAHWRVPSMSRVVAILADDVHAQETLLGVWREFSVPFKVMIYAGPYVIDGTILSDDKDPPEFYRQAFRPIENATIMHQEAQSANVISVRLGLVNVYHIHGYAVEK